MHAPDLNLILDNTLFGYSGIKNVMQMLADRGINEIAAADDVMLKKSIVDKLGAENINVQEADWGRLINLYEPMTAGSSVRKLKKYRGKTYSDIIYFPQRKSDVPSRTDILKFELAAGDKTLFDILSKQTPEEIEEIVAGSSMIEDETVNSIESFFESYDSKSSLMRSKVADISKWKKVESYDEFLQVPILKEGKDFMNKFLDIEETIAAGGVVEVEQLENLIPDYMIDGGANLTLLDAVDPKYSNSGYILGEGITDLAKDLINRAFLQTFSMIRSTTLRDLKTILERIKRLVESVGRRSESLLTKDVEAGMMKKKIKK